MLFIFSRFRWQWITRVYKGKWRYDFTLISAEDISDLLGSLGPAVSVFDCGTLRGVWNTPGVWVAGVRSPLSSSVRWDIGVTLIVSSSDLWSLADTGVLWTEPIKFLLTASQGCLLTPLSLSRDRRGFPDCWELLLTDDEVSFGGDGLMTSLSFLLKEKWVGFWGEGLMISLSFLLKEQRVCWGGEGLITFSSSESCEEDFLSPISSVMTSWSETPFCFTGE